MAAITARDVSSQTANFVATPVTLTASDTITYDARKVQLLVVNNATGGSLTLKIDGDLGTTVTKPGVGAVTVSGGYDIVIANNTAQAIVLRTISDYCNGTNGAVTLTGAANCTATLFNI